MISLRSIAFSALLFAGCTWNPAPTVKLNPQDLTSARNGFEDALNRKIQSEGGVAKNVAIEEAKLDEGQGDQVLLTYTLLYTIPGSTGDLDVTYRGASVLRASRNAGADPLRWHVIQTKQLHYSVAFSDGVRSDGA